MRIPTKPSQEFDDFIINESTEIFKFIHTRWDTEENKNLKWSQVFSPMFLVLLHLLRTITYDIHPDQRKGLIDLIAQALTEDEQFEFEEWLKKQLT